MFRVKSDSCTVELRLPGAFRAIDLRSGEDATPRGKKARALLAYVAMSDRHEITRERAACLLWSDRGAEQARDSLRQLLVELRSSIFAGLVVMDRERISVDPNKFFTDIGESSLLIHWAALRVLLPA